MQTVCLQNGGHLCLFFNKFFKSSDVQGISRIKKLITYLRTCRLNSLRPGDAQMRSNILKPLLVKNKWLVAWSAPSHYLNQWWNIVNSNLTNSSEVVSEIRTFAFRKMHLKMLSAKWGPFCLGLNVSTSHPWMIKYVEVSFWNRCWQVRQATFNSSLDRPVELVAADKNKIQMNYQ